jgi:hypothetical protein
VWSGKEQCRAKPTFTFAKVRMLESRAEQLGGFRVMLCLNASARRETVS